MNDSDASKRPRKSAPATTLAARITGWTNNLLATALVLILGLTFGVQIIRYWRGDAGSNAPVRLDQGDVALDLNASLEFGDFRESIQRQFISGDSAEATAAMVAQCAQILRSSQPVIDQPRSASEERLLAEVSAVTPAAEVPGSGKIYVQEGPMLMAIGVLESMPGRAATPESFGGKLPRVVCWTLALPFVLRDEKGSVPSSPPDRWTVVTCQPFADSAKRNRAAQRVQLPPGTRRTLAVETGQGGAMIGFTGSGSIAEVKRWFEDALQAKGWQLHSELSGPAQLRASREGEQKIDILLDEQYNPEQETKKLHGLIRISHQAVASMKD